jgi:hypothetical protein
METENTDLGTLDLDNPFIPRQLQTTLLFAEISALPRDLPSSLTQAC